MWERRSGGRRVRRREWRRLRRVMARRGRRRASLEGERGREVQVRVTRVVRANSTTTRGRVGEGQGRGEWWEQGVQSWEVQEREEQGRFWDTACKFFGGVRKALVSGGEAAAMVTCPHSETVCRSNSVPLVWLNRVSKQNATYHGVSIESPKLGVPTAQILPSSNV